MDPEEITLPSGETVTVRGLTGMEMALIGKRGSTTAEDPDSVAPMALQIGFAVLGKTTVRDAEAAGSAWLVGHPAPDFTAIMAAIERVSGFGQGAAKSGLHSAGND